MIPLSDLKGTQQRNVKHWTGDGVYVRGDGTEDIYLVGSWTV